MAGRSDVTFLYTFLKTRAWFTLTSYSLQVMLIINITINVRCISAQLACNDNQSVMLCTSVGVMDTKSLP